METYLRKYIGVIPVLVVAICAYFSAKAVNHIIEEKALGDSTIVGKAAKVTSPSKKKAVAVLSKNGEAVSKRNMFCSSCTPPEPEEAGEIVDSDSPPTTALPLRLVATNVSSLPAYSLATIQNTSTNREGGYSIEQMIPEAGEVVRIGIKFVDFQNRSTKRVERISLLSSKPVSRMPTSTARTPVKSKGKPKNELMAMVEEGVKKVGENDYEIDKKIVDKILENPMAVVKGARVVPSIKNGKSNGFKLYAIRPSSMYAKIGLKNGDTIHSINGFDLSSPDKALEVYTKLRTATSLSVNATRRGKPVSLNYNIR